MAFRLTPTESVPHGVARVFQEVLAESLAALNNPGEGAQFDASIHTARKNGKRLRAVLRLARPFLPPDVYQQENTCFRDTSRQLAPLRDGWVMVETLDKLGENGRWPVIRAQLLAVYEQERIRFVADTDCVAQVTAELTAAQARLAQLPAAHPPDLWLFEGIRRTYRTGQQLMWAALATGEAHLYHEWRKQVKYLWHQHELLEGVWPHLMREAAEAWHTLSSLLGDAHDLVVLQETVLALGEIVPTAEVADLLPLLAETQALLEAKARPLGGRLLAETPRAFAQRLAAYWQLWLVETAQEDRG